MKALTLKNILLQHVSNFGAILILFYNNILIISNMDDEKSLEEP